MRKRDRRFRDWCLGCLLIAATAWPGVRAFAGTLTFAQEQFIHVLFGSLEDPGGLDSNGDGMVTIADILMLSPDAFPTPTPTRPVPTPTPTPSPTLTPTPTPSPTLTPTAPPTPTETPIGLLFDGVISDLIPHAVGDRLVYRVTDPMGQISIETTLVTSMDGEGGFVIDDEVVRGEETTKHEIQSYRDTGADLFFGGATDVLRDLATVCSPMLLRLTMPVIAGQTSSTTVRCDVRIVSSDTPVGFIDRTDTFTPLARLDSLTVEAGTYAPVIHIQGSTNFSGDVEDNEIYLAPGIGAILQIATATGQVTRRELIDGTIGGQPVAR